MNSLHVRGRLIRTAMALPLALTLAAGCSSASDSGADPVLKLGIQEPYSTFLLDVAESQGYLADAGFSEMETTAFKEVPSMLTATSKGQITLAVAGVEGVFNFNKQSQPDDHLKIIGSRGMNLVAYMAAENSGIPVSDGENWQETVRAWQGKKIGIAAKGGIIERFVRYMVSEAGLDPDRDITLVAVGAGPAMRAALAEGLVDVASGSASVAAQIESTGAGRIVLPPTAVPPGIKDTLTSVFFTSQRQIDADPERFTGLAEAIDRAKEFISDPANRDESIEILTNETEMGPELAEIIFDIDLPSMTDTPVNPTVFDKTVTTYRDVDILDDAPMEYQTFVADDAR